DRSGADNCVGVSAERSPAQAGDLSAWCFGPSLNSILITCNLIRDRIRPDSIKKKHSFHSSHESPRSARGGALSSLANSHWKGKSNENHGTKSHNYNHNPVFAFSFTGYADGPNWFERLVASQFRGLRKQAVSEVKRWQDSRRFTAKCF